MILKLESFKEENGFNITLTGQAGGVFGHKLSEQGRLKCSEKAKGVYIGTKSPRARKINQYDMDGNFIKTWGSTTDIQRAFGVSYTSIVKCCTGVYKKSAGYKWAYVD